MDKPRDVLLFATADWDTPYWTNKQHTARHLAQLGFRVLYVESPGLRLLTVNRKDFGRILRRVKRGLLPPRPVEPGVWVLSPLAIPFKHHWPSIRTINQGWIRRRITRFAKRHGFQRPLVWTYHPFVLEALVGLDFSCLVYHCVDDLSALPRIDGTAFNAEEQRLLRCADWVFTAGKALQKKCATLNENTEYLPNVADFDHFSRARRIGILPPDLAAIPEPRIGYVGVLSDFKVDFALVLAVARHCPHWHWVFIGEEREGQVNQLIGELRCRPNVHFLGYKSYAVLPDYLRGFSVATLPCLINDYTRSMFPMKYFEYLAAGVPVVSTPLEFTKSHTAWLQVAAEPDAYVEAIARQLARGRLSDAEAVAAVGENTWKARLIKMLDRLGIRT